MSTSDTSFANSFQRFLSPNDIKLVGQGANDGGSSSMSIHSVHYHAVFPALALTQRNCQYVGHMSISSRVLDLTGHTLAFANIELVVPSLFPRYRTAA